MHTHTHTIGPRKVDMACTLSDQAKHFAEEGLAIWNGSFWRDIEDILRFGGVCLFKPNVPHQVPEIDAFAKIDLQQTPLRWSVSWPIASITKEAKNQRAIPLT